MLVFYSAEQLDIQPNKDNEMLLKQLKILQEENKQLVSENKQISTAFKQLTEENLHVKNDAAKHLHELQQLQENIKKNAETIAFDALRKVFTSGQIKRIMSPNIKRVTWSTEDICSAIALRSVSAKAYHYLRTVKNVPLPCVQTLRNWSVNFTVKPGILKDVVQIMQNKGQDLSIVEKLTILSFDELYISNKVDLEQREQKIYGPHKTSQIVMARGFIGNWRQPIFYDFDQPMTKEILYEIITCLQEVDYTVVAVTSDLGSTNVRLWKSMNIGVEIPSDKKSKVIEKPEEEKRCFFLHPSDKNLQVFVFADIPHMLKLARNNLFDSGFIVDGQLITKDILEELITLNSCDLKIAFNLTRQHLDVKGSQRQSVKLAAQVFSNRNAKAIEYCGKKNFLSHNNWKVMSKVLSLFNDWFDMFNCHSKFGKHSGLRAYGVDLQKQHMILDQMDELVSNMRTPKRSTLLPFQKGILLSNRSLRQLLPYVKETYSTDILTIDYIITRRLNQDILENLFSYIRAMGHVNDHPSPVDLKNRLKWYILGKHSGCALSKRNNTEIEPMSDSFMDVEYIHKKTSETSDCLDIQNDDFAEEAKLFMQVDHVETFTVNEDHEEEVHQEDAGTSINI